MSLQVKVLDAELEPLILSKAAQYAMSSVIQFQACK